MKKILLTSLEKHHDLGLLILRAGIGIMFMIHGAPKIFGGVDKWEKIGGAMGVMGIDFFPVFWGFMAAFSEFFGGLLLIIGFFSRPVCILLAITMFVAALKHYSGGDGFKGYSHALEMAIVFLGLIFIGPGKYSLDNKLFNLTTKNTKF